MRVVAGAASAGVNMLLWGVLDARRKRSSRGGLSKAADRRRGSSKLVDTKISPLLAHLRVAGQDLLRPPGCRHAHPRSGRGVSQRAAARRLDRLGRRGGGPRDEQMESGTRKKEEEEEPGEPEPNHRAEGLCAVQPGLSDISTGSVRGGGHKLRRRREKQGGFVPGLLWKLPVRSARGSDYASDRAGGNSGLCSQRIAGCAGSCVPGPGARGIGRPTLPTGESKRAPGTG